VTGAPEDLAQTPSVRQWAASYQQSWHAPLPEVEALDALRRFVAMCGTEPDAIVDEVLRPGPRGEGLVLRTRARRKYMQLIDEFEQREGSRRIANYVRSFLIHNGVAMNPEALK
jgi:hypothetical protein